jgi:iron complex outermembrane recepter protein
MKPIFATVMAFFCMLVSNAQTNNTKFVGKIQSQNLPVEAATVQLLKAKDSSIVKIAVSSKDGSFEISTTQQGNFLIGVMANGFAKYYSSSYTANGNIVEVKSIELSAVSKDLANVTVASKKPLVEMKLDRTIVNVDASPSNVGANALEVLEKSPGISVDKDGNISLKGKAGVLIYMDGKPAYVNGADLVNLLRSMQASNLDQIEIMTNPPAKYDASGNAGIINIKTKKSKAFGFNGSTTTGFGYFVNPRLSQSINANYRKNKINLFGNAMVYYNRSFQDLDIDRNFLDNSVNKNVQSIFNQTNNITKSSGGWNAKIGMDYFANKKTTIGGVFSMDDYRNTMLSDAKIRISNASRILQMRTNGIADNINNYNSYSANLNFKHIIDTTGKEISADVDYIKYNIGNDNKLFNSYFNGAGAPLMKGDTLVGDLPQLIDIFTAKVDFTMPLKGGAKFEAGLKTSFVKTDANAIYDSINYGRKVRDIGRSNHFIYNENVNAAYVSFSKPLSKKLSMQLGLRMEHMHTKGNLLTTNQIVTRDSVQLFPTAYFQYNLNDKNSFVLNYGRRVQRPNYESLNPFVEFLDRYTFEQGNPYLKPQFSHNIELTHSFKGFLTTTLNYTQTNDIMTAVLEQNTLKNETFVKQANVAKQQQFGISVNAFAQYTKWWSGNIYVNVFNNKFSGIVNGEYASFEATTGMINVSQNFKLKKGTSFDIGGFYRTKSIDAVFAINGFGVLNFGVNQPIMKGKGSIRFGVRDLLWSQKIKGSSQYGSVDAAFRQQQESRVISLNFTYRFNKGTLKTQQRKRSSGAEDEANRVGGGKG